jgi:hypothetical protein
MATRRENLWPAMLLLRSKTRVSAATAAAAVIVVVVVEEEEEEEEEEGARQAECTLSSFPHSHRQRLALRRIMAWTLRSKFKVALEHLV